MIVLPWQGMAHASVPLANQPVLASTSVPGNLALALSVEWPTASRTAHTANYTSASAYLGYFDPNKCYVYQHDATRNSTNTGDTSYFRPDGAATNRTCSGKWSGNFLNWAATPAIDPFRWAMTGGRRVVDTTTTTILEKAWHSGQGLFPDRTLPPAAIAGATPFGSATTFAIRVNGMGFRMRFSIAPTRTFTLNFYNDLNFTDNGRSPVLTWNNVPANYDWSGSPATGVNADNFSTRFTGTFTAPVTGPYRFRLKHDDAARMWLDRNGGSDFSNTTRILNEDNWTSDYNYPASNSFQMTAGQSFSIRIIQRDTGGNGGVSLEWALPTNATTASNSYETFSDPLSGSATEFAGSAANTGPYDLTMRVKVCDPSEGAGGVEANCKRYGDNYKPEGLVQQYAQDMRYSAFGYLNDSDALRDGGVLRARQKFVAPTYPRPGQSAATNTAAEWSSTNGVFALNPDANDASATTTDSGVTINRSGVINYLNDFGQLIPGNYKNHDPVSEMYYAVMRYFRNLGNVPEWSNMASADTNTRRTYLDGFPVITNWDDPIQYSCQRNFVLGIGDIYTHRDKNVPGNSNSNGEPSMPSAVSGDTTVNAVTATSAVGALQGVNLDVGTNEWSGRYNSAYMVGLAYDANTKDIRPDVATVEKTIGKQTVQTYWVDVLEQPFVANNQFYLAAKFGGLKVPSNFDPYTFAGTIPLDWWSTNGETVGSQTRPDNYFTAGRPDTMVSGLTRAFENIVGDIKAYTTSLSLSTAQPAVDGEMSYAAQYDSANWSGELTGRNITFADDGTPTVASTVTWTTRSRFETQVASAGWNTGRRIATWNSESNEGAGAGVTFRHASLTTAQRAALNTSYDPAGTDDSAAYLNWLRGDSSGEGSGYRSRSTTTSTGTVRNTLGDIVNSKVTPVSAPAARLADTTNPGYSSFKSTYATRPVTLYVGANDGMLHAFRGGSGATAGQEIFAYIPSQLFGRDPGDAAAPVDGLLAQLGKPQYAHRNYVDATALAFDVDFARSGRTPLAADTATNPAPDWRTVLIGGLGKGGRGYYAIDVTNPAAMEAGGETAVASKVLWEFPKRSQLPVAAGGTCPVTDDCVDMGYSFGNPVVVKTEKYGWVVALSSGYNNQDGKGYIFLVNPTNGALLEKIGTGATAAPGMAHPAAYVRDLTDFTADALYVGDLNGQLWRFNLGGKPTTYPSPTVIAELTDGVATEAAPNGARQPVTTQPLIEIHPKLRKRFVMIGTGRLLDGSDISSSQVQTFHAVIDGNAAGPGSEAGDGEDFPVTRDRLGSMAPPGEGETLPDVSGSAGWRLDLGTQTNVAWRVVSAMTAYTHTVAFATLLPSGDACNPSGLSRVYAMDYGTGKSMLEGAYVAVDGVVTDLSFARVAGKTRLLYGTNKGEAMKVPGTFDNPPQRKLLNWREVPVD